MSLSPIPKHAVLLVDGDFRLVRLFITERGPREAIQHKCDDSTAMPVTEFSFDGWSYCWVHQQEPDMCKNCHELVPPALSGFRKMVDWVP